MRRRSETYVRCPKPIAGVVFGLHPTAAEIGNLIMQITVFGGVQAKDFIVAQGILFIDGRHLSQFDLFG